MQKKNKTEAANPQTSSYICSYQKQFFLKSIKVLEHKSKIVGFEIGGFGLVGFFHKKAEEACAEANKELLINN